MSAIAIEPIEEGTLPEFAHFLSENMGVARSPEEWLRGLSANWSESRPNFGFMLRDGGGVAGGIGALYSDRRVGEQSLRLCNITSWCVLDSHRRHSMRLAMALTGQEGYHYTNFSPTPVVASVLKFLKFVPMDERQAVVPNIPWAVHGAKVLHRKEEVMASLGDRDARACADHAAFPWLEQLALGLDGCWCHVIYKRRRFKGLPAAGVIHLSDPDVFARGLRALGTYLLARGMATTHVERRLVPQLPSPHVIRSGFNPKLYLSETLTENDIDYLYSETVALDL